MRRAEVNQTTRRRFRSRQRLIDPGTRLRTLHRDDPEIAARSNVHLRRMLVALRGKPRVILVGGAGIDDETEPVTGKKINDQIVDHAARGIEQARVERRARLLQAIDVVGKHITQQITTARAAHVYREHVRHVEHPAVAPHAMMLFELRAVVQRHVPAAEIDHARAHLAMDGVERCHFERCCGHWCCPKTKKGKATICFAPLSLDLRDYGESATTIRVPLRWKSQRAGSALSRVASFAAVLAGSLNPVPERFRVVTPSAAPRSSGALSRCNVEPVSGFRGAPTILRRCDTMQVSASAPAIDRAETPPRRDPRCRD